MDTFSWRSASSKGDIMSKNKQNNHSTYYYHVHVRCSYKRVIYIYIYLTLCTFSFEIKESSLSYTRCLIKDVVSPHCGDKRMVRRWTRCSLPNYFDMTSYHWNVRQNIVTWHWWMNGKNNVTSCTKCSLPESIVQMLIQPLLFV